MKNALLVCSLGLGLSLACGLASLTPVKSAPAQRLLQTCTCDTHAGDDTACRAEGRKGCTWSCYSLHRK